MKKRPTSPGKIHMNPKSQKPKVVHLKLDGKPKKRPGGRTPVITEADVTNLEKCFELDFDVIQACDRSKIVPKTFYAKLKVDPVFRNRMIAAKKRAMAPIKENVIVKAAKNPWLGLKVLERREKKNWSPQISHDMKIAPVHISFDRPTNFVDSTKIPAKKEETDDSDSTDILE